MHGGVVLSLERMNRILEIDEANLIAIVDYNKVQSAGPTREIQDLEPLAHHLGTDAIACGMRGKINSQELADFAR